MVAFVKKDFIATKLENVLKRNSVDVAKTSLNKQFLKVELVFFQIRSRAGLI